MSPALAAHAATPADPAAILLVLAVILVAAKLGGGAAERIGQPAVLGELLVGILLGNLHVGGRALLPLPGTGDVLAVLANVGAVLLLFEVGLESTLRDMLRVGGRSLLVAVVGVIAPWVLGWAVGAVLLPGRSAYVHMFLGATLTATSVGITARVLKDLGRAQSDEGRIILGAAVIDDVIGLVILAGVSAVIAAADRGRAFSTAAMGLVLAKALVFLALSLWIGALASPRLFGLAARLPLRGTLLTTALALCFLLAWLASVIGLAPIVGAYAAGLVLEETHYHRFTARGELRLDDLVRPVSDLFVPVFFVAMGMHVDLRALANPGVLGLAAALTAAAVLGKQACALGGVGTTLDRVLIGIGMVPRGEVGLIFASIGLGLSVHGEPVVDARIFAAVVVAVMMTTLVTPPLLEWRLARTRLRDAAVSVEAELAA